MIKVLYLLPSLSTGGTERLVFDFATNLPRERFAAHVAAMDDGPLRGMLRRRDVPVTVLAQKPSRSRVRRWRQARCEFRALASTADVVHSHHLGALLRGTLAAWPSRAWAWVHTEHTRPDLELLYARWLVAACPVLLRQPDVLTGVAPEVTDYLRRHAPGPDERRFTIHNAIDLTRFTPHAERMPARARLGLPADALVFGTVGTLRPQKNHALLLEAFQRIRGELASAWLVVVGGGELRETLEAQARALGIADRVRFLGSRMDVPALLAAFDVYCLPSRYEGLPLSLLEAMAMELPVVATRVAGIRDVLHDGVDGLLVEPGDSSALAATLLRCAREPALAAALAVRGRRYVESTFSFETMLARYATLYERLVHGRPATMSRERAPAPARER